MPISANEYFKQRFGCKVYKLALDGGMSCPNRDGTKGSRGCIFCSGTGSGDFAEGRGRSVTEQIEAAKRRVAGKIRDGKYIAYFQSFTNTYAPLPYLEALFTEAISHPEVCALAVATRPDCLPEEVLALLGRLDRIKPVIVELGLQTIHPSTAEFIRRAYPLSDFDRAVDRLSALGLHTVVHVILGLPGETEDMIVQTVDYVGRSGAKGIKLQLLHVLEGTDLAALWRAGQVPTLSLEDYARLLGRCLAVLPEDMVIHRLTGDGAKRDLLAPLWSADKKRVLNYVNRYLSEHENADKQCLSLHSITLQGRTSDACPYISDGKDFAKMYFDSHAHLDDRRFDQDRDAIFEDLKHYGVGLIMNIGCDLKSSLQSIALAHKYPFVYAAVGSHPDDADHVDETLLAMYRQLCADEKVKAVGEIGLDYHYEDPPREVQLPAFRAQLELAKELGLPVIVHEREAHADGMELIRQFPELTGVFHCYSGALEQAKELVKRGWYIGFTGVVTFKNARKALEVAEWLPLDRILIETDCPYMAPEPHRGRRNDSRYVPLVAAKLAELRGLTPEEMGEITTENAKRLFRIP